MSLKIHPFIVDYIKLAFCLKRAEKFSFFTCLFSTVTTMSRRKFKWTNKFSFLEAVRYKGRFTTSVRIVDYNFVTFP